MGTRTTAARAWLYAAQHHFEVLGSSKVIILTARPGAAEVLAAFECGGVATSVNRSVFQC